MRLLFVSLTGNADARAVEDVAFVQGERGVERARGGVLKEHFLISLLLFGAVVAV